MLSTASDRGSQALCRVQGEGAGQAQVQAAARVVCRRGKWIQIDPQQWRGHEALQSCQLVGCLGGERTAHRSTLRSAARASGCCSARGGTPASPSP